MHCSLPVRSFLCQRRPKRVPPSPFAVCSLLLLIGTCDCHGASTAELHGVATVDAALCVGEVPAEEVR